MSLLKEDILNEPIYSWDIQLTEKANLKLTWLRTFMANIWVALNGPGLTFVFLNTVI